MAKKVVEIEVTPESTAAYEKARLAHLESLAKAAPVASRGPKKWVPPKLNDDGTLADTPAEKSAD